jgi:hypothetical protein
MDGYKHKIKTFLKAISVYIMGIAMFLIVCIFIIYVPFPKLDSLKMYEQISSRYSLIGTMTGAALAIIGAVWTQRKISKEQTDMKYKEDIATFYYSFQTTFFEVKKLYIAIVTGDIVNTPFRIYLDENIIYRIGIMKNFLKDEELYLMYNIINQILTVRDYLIVYDDPNKKCFLQYTVRSLGHELFSEKVLVIEKNQNEQSAITVINGMKFTLNLEEDLNKKILKILYKMKKEAEIL